MQSIHFFPQTITRIEALCRIVSKNDLFSFVKQLLSKPLRINLSANLSICLEESESAKQILTFLFYSDSKIDSILLWEQSKQLQRYFPFSCEKVSADSAERLSDSLDGVEVHIQVEVPCGRSEPRHVHERLLPFLLTGGKDDRSKRKKSPFNHN